MFGTKADYFGGDHSKFRLLLNGAMIVIMTMGAKKWMPIQKFSSTRAVCSSQTYSSTIRENRGIHNKDPFKQNLI